ncbi:MAG TPA: hypothetical protein DCE56_12275 [Cyanobacteria bacterium UBA8553]|nr:hypothetical protein [Cyanobacteria bacterium UBA8553]HAJ62639.1 hypothetical protein [Cyanobacteria bacterium UBA8543]
MRTFTPILLLSLLTLSTTAIFRLIPHGATAQIFFSTNHQLLAAMTTTQEGYPRIPDGRKPKRFFQSQDNFNS